MRLVPRLICLFAITCSLAHAEVWEVDPGGGGDFITIQEAIVASAGGDEIRVHPGTYLEHIDYLGKDLYVHSLSGPAATIIDGSGELGSCVSLRSGESLAATLEGFTVSGGTGTSYSGHVYGGGILCVESQCTIWDCVVVGNHAEHGGGLALTNGCGAEVSGCHFVGNECDGYGGAVSLSYGFINLSECVFEANHSNLAVGGVSLGHHAQGEVTDCQFLGNSSPYVGGMTLGQATSQATVTRCWFEGNQSFDLNGGGLRVHEGTLFVIDCTFVNNHSGANGGGLVAYDGCFTSVSGCTFYGNGAEELGGNVYFGAGTHELSHCIIAHAAEGDGVYAPPSAEITCCDAWANAGQNYSGISDPTGTDGNISVDPIFCEETEGDFTLRIDSPCAAENNPECGQIGAWGIGCEIPTPTRAATWGEVKALYR